MLDPLTILANQNGDFSHSVLFIGGYGLRVHGYFRNTNDIDVLSSRSDLESLELELQKIGYKRAAETPIFARFENDDLIFAPIDVLLLDDQVFEKLAATATEGQLSNNSVLAPSPLNFIALKLHAIKNDHVRKHKDLADIRELITRHGSEIDEAEYLEIIEKYAPPQIVEEIREWINF